MHITLRIIEYTEWTDPRLAYANNSRVDNQFKDYKMDISDVRYNIWKPSIAYTELSKVDNITEIAYLFKNGTIIYFKELMLTLTCEFNFGNMPSDNHACLTTSYIQNEFNDTAFL